MTRPLVPELVEQLERAELTYVPAGLTEPGAGAPLGYHRLVVRSPVGTGPVAFAAVTRGVLSWQLQERAGLRVSASDPVVRLGGVAVLGLGLGRLMLHAPVRIVTMIDEPQARGFAYGTLPGHPEQGEERFVVEHDDDDQVWLRITACSRPGRWFTAVAGPVGRWAQRLVTARYVAAARQLAREGA